MYMTPRSKVNKEFLKLVFGGKKKLIPRDYLRPIKAPGYIELTVKSLWGEIRDDEELLSFFS